MFYRSAHFYLEYIKYLVLANFVLNFKNTKKKSNKYSIISSTISGYIFEYTHIYMD